MRSLPKIASTLTLGILLASCARNRGIHEVVETRERIFYAKNDLTPEMMATTKDSEATQVSYRSIAGLNFAFERLAADGFKLVKVEPVLDGNGATKFIFERRVAEAEPVSDAPAEYAGLYEAKAEKEGDPSTFYALTPEARGFHIVMFGAGGDFEHHARWDGRHLAWRNGVIEDVIQLAPDARSIVHTRTELAPAADPANVSVIAEALRVEAEAKTK